MKVSGTLRSNVKRMRESTTKIAEKTSAKIIEIGNAEEKRLLLGSGSTSEEFQHIFTA